MDDELFGSITGTATYHELSIEQVGEFFEVTGTYHESQTTYQAPQVEIGGVVLDSCSGEIAISPGQDETFVWIDAKEDLLRVLEENPD